MISDWKTKNVSESMLPHAIDVNYNFIQRQQWKTFRPLVLQTMISLKFGFLPWLEKHGIVSKSLTKPKNTIECKNWKMFKYYYKGLDVLVHKEHDEYLVFVLFDDTGYKELYTDSEDRMDWIGLTHFMGRFSNHDVCYTEIEEKSYFSGSNLSRDEFNEYCKKLYFQNFLVFTVENFDREDSSDVETGRVLNLILSEIASGSTNDIALCMLGWKDYDDSVIKVRELINTTSEQCELHEHWEMALFDYNVSQIYTKNFEENGNN